MIFQNKCICVAFIAMSLTVVFSGCRGDSAAKREPNAYWYENGGVIRTNDLPRLQRLVPFTIRFPELLPEDITGSRLFEAVIPDMTTVTNTEVRIYYRPSNQMSPRMLEIKEVNSRQINLPASGTKYTYLEINGVTVLEQENLTSFLADRLASMDNALRYSWFYSDISYILYATAFDRTEARKVIASMCR